jgi:hypothetical protein
MLRALYLWAKNRIYPPKKDNFVLEQLPRELQFEVLKFRSPSENSSAACVSKNLNKKLSNNILWNEYLNPEHRVKDDNQSAKQIFIESPEQRLDKYNPPLCPITGKKIRHPVICILDGYIYEELAITNWLFVSVHGL